MYISYQDFEKTRDKAGFLRDFINWHKSRLDVRTAFDADRYDRQMNTTIMQYARTYYTLMGAKRIDKTASNNKIASNFFHRLNTQRCAYLLGNGVTFTEDGLKEKLGQDFDTRLMDATYKALIHGVSFIFWNVDHIHIFPLTEFAPLWDEETGALMAGVRYWQIDKDKPEYAVLYEIDGWQKYRADELGGAFAPVDEKKPYRYKVEKAPVDDEPEIIAAENYSSLPIIPIYGTRQKQSTLVGMKPAIDSYDLIRSGFANDLSDCAECYWVISNANGMDDADLARFRDRMKLNHIVEADEGDVTPYTQELPYAARTAYLDSIRKGIFEDFGGLDVDAISAANQTATAIESAYQPLDENADDLEYQVIEAIKGILDIIGETGTPVFKRNRISNQLEQTQMVATIATYLDEQTILEKLPFITPDEIDEILKRKDEEGFGQFNAAVNEVGGV